MLTALMRRNTRKGTTKPDTSIRGRRLSTHGEPTSLHKRLTPNPANKKLLSPIQHEAPAIRATRRAAANIPPGLDHSLGFRSRAVQLLSGGRNCYGGGYRELLLSTFPSTMQRFGIQLASGGVFNVLAYSTS